MTRPHLYRCRQCGKYRYPTWGAAKKALHEVTHFKGHKGLNIYWSRSCSAYHIGKPTNSHRKRENVGRRKRRSRQWRQNT